MSEPILVVETLHKGWSQAAREAAAEARRAKRKDKGDQDKKDKESTGPMSDKDHEQAITAGFNARTERWIKQEIERDPVYFTKFRQDNLRAGEARATESKIRDLKEWANDPKHYTSENVKLLSEGEKMSIMGYTCMLDQFINDSLRKDDPSWKSYEKSLNAALDKLPPHQGKVWRLATLPDEIADRYQPGKTVQEKAFTSTSLAKGGASSAVKGKYNVQFRITSKTGREIPISRFTAEKEILFKSNTKFKVVSNAPVKGRNVREIHLEEV